MPLPLGLASLDSHGHCPILCNSPAHCYPTSTVGSLHARSVQPPSSVPSGTFTPHDNSRCCLGPWGIPGPSSHGVSSWHADQAGPMDLQLSLAAWGCPVGADTTSLPFGPLPRTRCLPGWGEGRQRGIREISILEGLSRSRKVPRYDNPRLPEPPAWCGVGKPPESPSSQ